MAETSPGDARATERLHQYWVHGEGAAKIRWGDPGDFDRCVRHLGKFISDPQGYCNLAHHAALGIYPATHAAMEHGRAAMADKKPYGDVTYADPKNGKYPVDTEEHARAAWSYINQEKNSSSSRAENGPLPFVRSFPLQDISIRAGGDGRTVDAYATVFDTPAPIHDKDGDYIEVIDHRAFDRILEQVKPQADRKAWRVGVFYNHGMTLHGTPSSQNSLPIGIPLEIKADGHGLFTRTRYSKGADIDRILDAISEGSLSAYSFSGAFRRSTPLVPRGGFRPDRYGNLPTVKRTESTLREYGPTPFPSYEEAAITAVRAEQLIQQLEPLPSGAPEDRDLLPGDLPSSGRSVRSTREEILANRSAFLQKHRRQPDDRGHRPSR